MVILPVDQGFEHGPARSFAPNPPAYDPHYHYQLAIEAGLNAYAAPLGMIEAGADTFAGAIPTILKLNSCQPPGDQQGPGGHRLGEGRAAARLRGDRLHDLSRLAKTQYEQMEETPRARRGGEGGRPRRRDVDLSARRQARQGGRDGARHLRLRRAHGGAARRPHHQGEAADRRAVAASRRKKAYEKADVDISTLAKRASSTSCRRPSTAGASWCSPAARRRTSKACSTEVRGLRDGGANGSIIGRNTFQRPKRQRARDARQDHRHLSGQGLTHGRNGRQPRRLPRLPDHAARRSILRRSPTSSPRRSMPATSRRCSFA